MLAKSAPNVVPGALKTMLLTKLKFGALVVLIFGAMGAAHQDAKKERVDQQCDPLPDQALLRIDTTRLQHVGEVRAFARHQAFAAAPDQPFRQVPKPSVSAWNIRQNR